MTTEQTMNIDPRRLFNLGANLVAAGFIKQEASEAKKLFKDLKKAALLKVVNLNLKSLATSFLSNLS
jgi:hypothetical protein